MDTMVLCMCVVLFCVRIVFIRVGIFVAFIFFVCSFVLRERKDKVG